MQPIKNANRKNHYEKDLVTMTMKNNGPPKEQGETSQGEYMSAEVDSRLITSWNE